MKRLGVLLLPPGWEASPSQGTQHEETRGITTPPGWEASPSQSYHSILSGLTNDHWYQ